MIPKCLKLTHSASPYFVSSSENLRNAEATIMYQGMMIRVVMVNYLDIFSSFTSSLTGKMGHSIGSSTSYSLTNIIYKDSTL